MNKSQLLRELYRAARTNQSEFVPGSGNPDATLMVIGQAPEAEEIATGIPFVGKSGVILNGLLSEIGVSRSNFYITNVSKIPVASSSSANGSSDISLLFNEIEIVKPDIIFALRKTVADALFPASSGSPLREERGVIRWLSTQTGDYRVITAYHPTALLRGSASVSDMRTDYEFLRRSLYQLGL